MNNQKPDNSESCSRATGPKEELPPYVAERHEHGPRKDPSFEAWGLLRLITAILAVGFAILTIAGVMMGIQYYNNQQFLRTIRENLEEQVEVEVAKAEKTIAIMSYSMLMDWPLRRITTYRDDAVWELLGILKRAQDDPSLFPQVVPMYERVLPHLRLDVKADSFRDSYRGEVWMSVILLNSGVTEIRGALRKVLPPEEVLRRVLKENVGKVTEDHRLEFQDSIEQLIALSRKL